MVPVPTGHCGVELGLKVVVVANDFYRVLLVTSSKYIAVVKLLCFREDIFSYGVSLEDRGVSYWRL